MSYYASLAGLFDHLLPYTQAYSVGWIISALRASQRIILRCYILLFAQLKIGFFSEYERVIYTDSSLHSEWQCYCEEEELRTPRHPAMNTMLYIPTKTGHDLSLRRLANRFGCRPSTHLLITLHASLFTHYYFLIQTIITQLGDKI